MLASDDSDESGAMEQRLFADLRGPDVVQVVNAIAGFLFILPPLASLMRPRPHDQTHLPKSETTRLLIRKPHPKPVRCC